MDKPAERHLRSGFIAFLANRLKNRVGRDMAMSRPLPAQPFQDDADLLFSP